MFYEPRLRNHGLSHDPFKAIIAPRPIGWISTQGANGALNLAPYSYFNALSTYPPIVGFSSEGRKDSVTFAGETGEFVCNLVTEPFAQAMNVTAGSFPRGTSEFGPARLEPEASRLVRPPRIKGIAAALECRTTAITQLARADGTLIETYLVMGEVIGIHVDPQFVAGGRIDTAAMRIIARLGYAEYARVSEAFTLDQFEPGPRAG